MKHPQAALLIGLFITSTAWGADSIALDIFAASSVQFDGAVSRVGPDSRKIYTTSTPAVTLSDFAGAEIQETSFAGPALVLRMTTAGAKKMAALSQQQLNSHVAVVLNGKVISAPIVRTVMTDRLMIAPSPPRADTLPLVDHFRKDRESDAAHRKPSNP